MTAQSVAVIVRNEEGEVLLHKREDFRIWTLPGGGIESGETWEQAAIRETQEETGYQIAVESLMGRYRRPQFAEDDCVFVAQAYVTGGEPIARGPETVAVGWFSESALPARLSPFARLYMQDALSDAPKPLEKTLRLSARRVLIMRLLLRLRGLRNRFRGTSS